MNVKQQHALDIALAGHNVLLLGSAGTGKSHTLLKIKDEMNAIGKSVKITCSTGIACRVYGDNASTIHRFLGLSDGRFRPDHINEIHKENSFYNYVEHNLQTTDCLILDECSMISKRTFELIFRVCSRKKNLQLIFCGDFYQLPPVANETYMDFGEFCFDSELFDHLFPHRVILTEGYRTKDQQLAKCVSDVFSGKLNPETSNFIHSLKRPLPPGEDSVKMFSCNRAVENYNRDHLLQFPGEIFEIVSKDSGDKKVLDRIMAPNKLWLKNGCPIILLQNLSNKLVNGLIGFVEDITIDGIVVSFPDVNVTKKITKVKFSVFDPSIGADIAVREQYPLRLAFALTIHKAQGMTLDRVEVDCQDIFKPGQLGVALSRATTSTGLRVINFHPRYVMKPQKSVTDFMKIPSRNTEASLDCCRSCFGDADITETVQPESESCSSMDEYSEPDPEDSAAQTAEESFHLDDDFDTIIKEIVTDEVQLQESFISEGLLDKIKKSIFIDREITSSQKKMNEIVSRLNHSNFVLFVKKILLKMKECVQLVADKDEPITKGIPEQNMNKFYSHVHEYSIGPAYKLNCLFLFENENKVTEEHMVVCYKIIETIRMHCLKEKSDLIQNSSSTLLQRCVTDTSKARIRYVAGYCVAKLRKQYMKREKSNTFSITKEGQASYTDSKCKIAILNQLKEDEQYLMDNSSQPESLIDTEQKQGRKRGLTNVTDPFYLFFLELTNISLRLIVSENLIEYGKDLFAYCLEKLNNEKKLFEMFSGLLENQCSQDKLDHFDITDSTDSACSMTHIKDMYLEVTVKYLSVLMAQFRRDIKSMCKVDKKMAHRKQIRVPSSKSKKCECSGPTKARLCSAKSTKSADKELKSGLTEPQSSTSAEYQPSQASTLSDKCQMCNKDNNDDFIQCDSCDLWFHRKCAGLKNTRLWNKLTKTASQWFCKRCACDKN